MRKAFILFIILLPLATFAQVKIKGRVLNQPDTKPVANASVFLSNATNGDKTAADGTFTLQNVKPGKYELVISIVGFDAYSQPITVTNTNITLPDIAIFPKTMALKEVTVKVNSDPDRKRNYDWFKDEFLGTSDLAKECKILNPEMLDLSYDYKTGTLTASSVDFLAIQNNALGYKIQYLLSNFTLNNLDQANKSFSFAGSIFFEEMEGSPSQKKQWQARRQEVYEGSQMRFLQSALHDELEQSGFRVLRLPLNTQRPPDSLIDVKLRVFNLLKNDDKKFRDSLSYWEKKAKLPKFQSRLIPYPLTRQDIIGPANKQGLYTFGCNDDALFITYNKYHRFGKTIPNSLADPGNTDNTLVSFNNPVAFFDNNGAVENPGSLTYDGVWLRRRIAGLLPLNYETQQGGISNDNNALSENIAAKLKAYSAANIMEKAYLHFDKPYYAAGDTIYFKTYVTEGGLHSPSQLSKVLYVALINADNNAVRSVTLHLADGLAQGDFALPDSLQQGNYHVRAYTNYMRNAGEDYFFDKLIPIVNSPIAEKSAAKKLNTKPVAAAVAPPNAPAKFDVQFFPEGGTLLAGNKAVIGFKAVAPNGFGADIKGVIIDDKGHEAGSFSSSHLGMGLITLTPDAGKNYRAKISYPGGSIDVIDLPKASDKGYSLSIDNTNVNELKIKVKAGKSDERAALTLIAQAGEAVYYSGKVTVDNKAITIPKDKFPSGIIQFTLFSADGDPLNERLVFIQNPDKLRLGLAANQKYAPRQKVKINITAANGADKPVSGSFSVSVTDESKVPVNEATESTILSTLLLTADLKGYIENPNYYFVNESDKTRADLDVLMLTQGYRRFVWKQVMDSSYPAIAWQPQKAMELSGVIKTSAGKPVPNGKITMMAKASGLTLLDTVADENGRFVFKNLAFNDTLKMTLQGHKENGGREVKIEVDSITPSFATKVPGLQVGLTDSLSAYLKSSKQFHNEQAKYGVNKSARMLNTVVIKERRQVKEGLEDSQNLNGKGNADQVLTSKELESSGLQMLYEVLKSRLASVRFYKGMLISNRSITGFKGGQTPPMIVVVDGMVMDDLAYVSQIQTVEVQSVEVLLGARGGAIYGAVGANGVVIITSKKGRKGNYESYAPGIISYKAKGYYKARQFYAPRYDDPKINKYIPDMRSTIYWKPDVLTDENGKASIEYFNADSPGTYRIVIEGIDADGNLGRQVMMYKVE